MRHIIPRPWALVTELEYIQNWEFLVGVLLVSSSCFLFRTCYFLAQFMLFKIEQIRLDKIACIDMSAGQMQVACGTVGLPAFSSNETMGTHLNLGGNFWQWLFPSTFDNVKNHGHRHFPGFPRSRDGYPYGRMEVSSMEPERY